jgi:protein-S-isoprenylcysteine O-methyltransferase Ste14
VAIRHAVGARRIVAQRAVVVRDASPMQRAIGWVVVVVQLALLVGAAAAPGPQLVDLPAPFALTLRVLGSVAIVAAVVALTGLGRALTASPVPREEGALATTGVYGVVRHPVYLLLGGGALALALASGGAGRLLCAAVLVLLLAAKARWEERMLRDRFPDYAAYARRVGVLPRRPRP